MKNYFELWDNWEEYHDTPDQQKRLISAKKAECTPVSIDKSKGAGVFSGSHGVYNTTLETCKCVDFVRRKLPCKHMYRLAIEFGLIESASAITDTKAIKAPDFTQSEKKQALIQVIGMLETYSEEVQNSIREMIYYTNANKLYPCENINHFEQAITAGLLEVVRDYGQAIRAHTQKHTLERLDAAGFSFPEGLKNTKKARYEWCLENCDTVGIIAFPNFAFLQPAGFLKIAQKKVYTYLLRKFTNDSYIGEDGNNHTIPHGAELFVTVSDSGVSSLHVQFPDDDVTALLNKYNANRCKGFQVN